MSSALLTEEVLHMRNAKLSIAIFRLANIEATLQVLRKMLPLPQRISRKGHQE
jgi:hypothetical protein